MREPAELPRSVAAQITRPPFTAAEFTPTKFNSAADKAKFANHLMRFIAGDFQRSDFTQPFYDRLCLTFGHTAHYDRDGFWFTFFDTAGSVVDFLNQTIDYGRRGIGDPAYTFSDVRKAVVRRLEGSGVLQHYESARSHAVEAKERAYLARLQAKYGDSPTPGG